MQFILVMEKLNFSLQCHMILQKSFWFAAQETLLLYILKTFVLLNIFVETVKHFWY